MFLQLIHLLKWNSPGSILSYLCLIHCLIPPGITALLPITMILDESAHVCLFTALTLGVALTAWMGYRKHRQVTPGAVMAVSIALVGIAAFMPTGERVETVLTVAGSLLLIAGHIADGRVTHIHRIVMQQS